WLIRVALNYYYDQCRKNNQYIFNSEEIVVEARDVPDSIIVKKEPAEEFHILLSKLKPLFSELLLLKYEFNFSYVEISQLIGISTSSVKTNLFRARKKNSSYCTRRISMTKKGTSNENVKIDFVSNSAFQKSVKKAKRLQVLLYIFISFVTLIVLMVVTHFGIQYLINEKIEKERIVTSRVMTDNPIKGAAISVYHTRYRHNIFSSESETVLYKTIGDREIVWDIVLKKYPAIGAVEV